MKLTPLLTDHAVIQRRRPIPVWGWTATPRTRLRATLSTVCAEGISGDDGRFLLRLPALEAGGPLTLVVETLDGSERSEVHDIKIGEVWLASGQSNMEWTLANSEYHDEIRQAHPGQIRMFTVAHRAQLAPQSTVCGQWEISSPDTAGQFSAVAAFFGNRLQDELGIPVGIINASWGGSFIETWISRERLLATPLTREWVRAYESVAFSRESWARQPGLIELTPSMGHGNQNSPYICFDNMIRPLLPVEQAGVIWYQGESNADNPAAYRVLLQALIADWRARLAPGEELPFGIVQLPNYLQPEPFQVDSNWAGMREAQAAALTLPGTGLAVIIDSGEAGNIHPRNKQPVGYRLAQWALAEVYGQAITAGAPLYSGHSVEGNRIRITFGNTGTGLALTEGDQVRTLCIAGAEGQFKPAESTLEGTSLLVWHAAIPAPRHVRYAWANNPEGANLVNSDGFPAGPFRTDTP